ncbi:MAG: polysaccharide deacetylase family protein [Negativicutes bacterium]|nr:polysaccharide deacetylase family protein [Negativicutes bacterium]
MWIWDIRLSSLLAVINTAVVLLLLADYYAVWRHRPRRLPFYLALLLIGAGGVAVGNALWPASGFYGQVYGESDFQSVSGSQFRPVAITFDDGPSPPYTTELLAVLRAYHVPATFFLVGEKAARYPQLVREIHGDGHEIGNHTWDHRDLLQISRVEAWQEIDRTNEIIQNLTGVRPQLLRPPHGFRDRTIIDMAGQRGMRVAEWTVMARDWQNPGVDVIVDRILSGVSPGAIILLHDGDGRDGVTPRRQTVEAVKRIIPALLAQGYTFVRVSEIPWPMDWRQPVEEEDHSRDN